MEEQFDQGIDTKVYFKRHFPEKIKPAELDVYLDRGWFRTQNRMYTCTHIRHGAFGQVDRVWWLRFPVYDVNFHRSHDKIRSKNSIFHVKVDTLDSITEEMEELYLRYKKSVSFKIDKTVFETVWKDVDSPRIVTSKVITVLDGDKLIGVSVFDIGDCSGMAILNFYDPEYVRFSLGKFMILVSVDYLKANGYTYFYPGYIVVNHPKLNYKLFLGKEVAEYFHPDKDGWVRYHDDILIQEQYSSNTMHMLYNEVFRIWS